MEDSHSLQRCGYGNELCMIIKRATLGTLMVLGLFLILNLVVDN